MLTDGIKHLQFAVAAPAIDRGAWLTITPALESVVHSHQGGGFDLFFRKLFVLTMQANVEACHAKHA